MVVFIEGSIETFDFGDILVKWIKTFYANPKSVVANNGFATPFSSLNVEFDRGIGAPFLESFLL